MAFFLFRSEYRPKFKGKYPGLSIGDVAKKLGEMWNNTAVYDKQPYEKAAKLKEKYKKDIAAYKANGKPDAVQRGVVMAEKSKKRRRRKMRRMKRKRRKKNYMKMKKIIMMNKLVLAKFYFLIYKALNLLVHNSLLLKKNLKCKAV